MEKELQEDMKISQREQVRELLNSIESGDSKPAKYINSQNFKQHNLTAGDGVAGFANFLSALKEYPEPAKVNIIRIFEDGDYVFAHTEYNLFGEKIGFDVFRFEEGQIVEHWDNLQDTPKDKNPSGNRMTDGVRDIIDLDKTEENKELVRKVVEDLFVNQNYYNIETYFKDNKYIQHNPEVGNGVLAFGALMQEWTQKGIILKYKSIQKVLGEGDFVLTICDGMFGENGGVPTSFYDLFRVEEGVIVEHWDVIESIAKDEDKKNNNGKFGFR